MRVEVRLRLRATPKIGFILCQGSTPKPQSRRATPAHHESSPKCVFCGLWRRRLVQKRISVRIRDVSEDTHVHMTVRHSSLVVMNVNHHERRIRLIWAKNLNWTTRIVMWTQPLISCEISHLNLPSCLSHLILDFRPKQDVRPPLGIGDQEVEQVASFMFLGIQ